MFYPRTSSFLSKTAVKSSSSVEAELFVDENEMVPIAENYSAASGDTCGTEHGSIENLGDHYGEPKELGRYD
jgi:hypothetical protein